MLCYFVKLNGMIKGMLFLMSKKKKKKMECYSLFDHQEREMASTGGISASLDCFILVKNTCSHTCISSTIKKKYCTNI